MLKAIRSPLRAALVIMIGAFLCCQAVQAQSWPTKPIRFIIPYPPGSGIDIIARLLSPRIAESLGQPLVVENRPGAGASIGVDAVAKGAPDGHIIGFADTGPLANNPALYPDLPYSPMRDLAPIIQVGTLPFMLVVNPSLGVSSVKELIAAAKLDPGKINYASVGNGSSVHLTTELFKKQAGIDMTHIPYKGSAPALIDVVSGRTPVMFVNLLSGLTLVKAGKLRVLAVASGKRIAALPDVPTVAEAGVPDYQSEAWMGIIAPAGTPALIVKRLNAEFNRVLEIPGVRDQLLNQGGVQVVGGTPAQFSALIDREIKYWGKLVKETGAHVD